MGNVSVLSDWKKWGSFVGVEYKLQVSGYWGMPYAYDRQTKRIWKKPVADYAIVTWVGEKGVSRRLVMDKDELEEGYKAFKLAVQLYRFKAKHDTFFMGKPRTYKIPPDFKNEYVSVTEILKHVIAKPGLMDWHYDAGLEGGIRLYNASHCDMTELFKAKTLINEKTAEDKDKALWKKFKDEVHSAGYSPYARRDKAGDMGTVIHKNILFLLSHKDVDLTNAPEWLNRTMENMTNWVINNVKEVQLLEQMVFDPEIEIAGSLDAQLLCDESVVKKRGESDDA